MNPPRFAEHNGIQILVLSMGTLFLYVFSKNNQWFMQWTKATRPWWRWLMVPFGWPVIEPAETAAIQQTFIEHAMRSIDKMDDPEAEHCIHSVKISGKDAAKCMICSYDKPK